MPLTVTNMSDQALWLTQFLANNFHNINILLLVMSTDIIYFSNTAFVNNQVNSLTMIFNIQPIANIKALTINRQWFIS